MARKKRSSIATAPPVADKTPSTRYQDNFQQSVGRKVEEAGKKLEGQQKNILYGLAALAVIAVIAGIFYVWSSRTNAAGQAALGKAIETSQSPISDMPRAAGERGRTFKTMRERAEASIAEFQAVVDQHGGSAGEKAKYFIALNRLVIDRPAAVSELEGLATSGGEVGALSKFALAQTRAEDGRTEEAIALYKELADARDSVVAKDTVNLELAKLYEKQGQKAEAVEILFAIAKAGAEAKDPEGNPLPMTPSSQSARDLLIKLDPEKAKELPAPSADPSLGTAPFEIEQ